MSEVQATTTRAFDPSRRLRDRHDDLLREWEASETTLETMARERVRTFVGQCLEHVARALAGGSTPPTPDLGALTGSDDLPSAARATVFLRGLVLRQLEIDDRPLLCEQRIAAEVLDRALLDIVHRLDEMRSSAEERASRFAASERGAREREERLRAALDASELGTWEWDLRTNAMEWSERAKALFGIGPQDQVDCSRFLSFFVPDDRDAIRELIEQARVGHDGGFSLEHRVVRADTGEERWVATRGCTQFDEQKRPRRVFGTVLDITAARRREQRARFVAEASKLLASSLDHRTTIAHVAQMAIPEVCDFCSVDIFERGGDTADRVAFAHRNAEKLAIGTELRRRWGPHDVLVEVARGGRVVVFPEVTREMLQQHARDPEHFELLERAQVRSAILVPLATRGEVLGVMVLGHSDSGRRFGEHDVQLAEELGRLASQAIANAQLHREVTTAAALRERMLAIVSHDLRSPLAAIDLGSAVLLELPATQRDPLVQKQVALIRRNVDRMSRLIGDLLDMSSIQAGALTLERSPCALGALLAETLEAHEPLAREKSIALRSEVHVGERVACCDRDRIHQVLSNLLGNAIKFSEPGGEVRLLAEERGTEARVTVIDTGPGIPEADLPHVFELFWKGSRHGTGLGLFIARGIVEAHGGRIGVESRSREGSTFWFTLPLNGPGAAEP